MRSDVIKDLHPDLRVSKTSSGYDIRRVVKQHTTANQLWMTNFATVRYGRSAMHDSGSGWVLSVGVFDDITMHDTLDAALLHAVALYNLQHG
jgi:hypothetical protein